MGGLWYSEGLTKFILESVDEFGSLIPMIFVIASFWAISISYAPFSDNFDDILACLLIEM
jgi:hypothetical protein